MLRSLNVIVALVNLIVLQFILASAETLSEKLPKLQEADKAKVQEFDCLIRDFTVEFAQRIQPFRTPEDIKTLARALDEDGSPCGPRTCKRKTKLPRSTENQTDRVKIDNSFEKPCNDPMKLVNAEEFQSYAGCIRVVASLSFTDDSPTTLNGKFISINSALQDIRMFRRSSYNGPCVILLRQGVHVLSDPIKLIPEDSNLSIQSCPGEQGTISGAKYVLNEESKWTKSNYQNIWEMNLSSKNIEEVTGLRFGDSLRAVRARYPNGCATNKPGPSGYACRGFAKPGQVVQPADGFGSSLLIPKWKDVSVKPPTRQNIVIREIFRNDTTYNQFYQVGVGGHCHRFNPPVGYWCGEGCSFFVDKPATNCLFKPAGGIKYSKTLFPNSPYKDPDGAIVQTWRDGHWATSMYNVSGSKSDDNNLYFESGGHQDARNPGSGEFTFIENVFEEMDAEMEFFFNKTTKILYLYSSQENPGKFGYLRIPHHRSIILIEGNGQTNLVKNIFLEDVIVQDTRIAYMDEHMMPSGGDWAISMHAAIYAHGGVENFKILGSTFQYLDGNAILIKGYSRDVIIERNRFTDIGETMVALLGETKGIPGMPNSWGMGWDGRDGNQSRGTVIRLNWATRPGLFQKQSSFVFVSKAMQIVIEKNIHFDGPRAGININDGFGGGHIIRDNILFNTVQESGDHGPINGWDRQPYVYDTNSDGSIQMKPLTTMVYRNLIYGDYYTNSVVDNDDGSAYFETHHNAFVYGMIGLKNHVGGHNNYHHDNFYGFMLTLASTSMPTSIAKFNTFIGYGAELVANNNVCCKTQCATMSDNKVFLPKGLTSYKVCGMDLLERQKHGDQLRTTVSEWPEVLQMIDIVRNTLKQHVIGSSASVVNKDSITIEL